MSASTPSRIITTLSMTSELSQEFWEQQPPLIESTKHISSDTSSRASSSQCSFYSLDSGGNESTENHQTQEAPRFSVSPGALSHNSPPSSLTSDLSRKSPDEPDLSHDSPQSSPISDLSRKFPEAHVHDNVVDVDAWLARPDNLALLQGATRSSEVSPVANKDNSSQQKDVQDPDKTGFDDAVHNFNKICSQRGIKYEYDIWLSGVRGRGTLEVAGQRLVLEPGVWGNKRRMKRELAERGLEWLRNQVVPPYVEPVSKTTMVPGGSGSFVTKLQEYYMILPGYPMPEYQYSETEPDDPASGFRCTVTLPAEGRYGKSSFSSPQLCRNKRLAKAAAAHEAFKYLIKEGYLDQDGRVPKKARGAPLLGSPTQAKKPKFNFPNADDAAAASASASGPSSPFTLEREGSMLSEEVSNNASYVSRVPLLAATLGIRGPEYRFELARKDVALYSGAAYFPGTVLGPALPGVSGLPGGPIGEVREVFGKKKAKEECAKKVCAYLENHINEKLKSIS